jgi:hypothetical protein
MDKKSPDDLSAFALAMEWVSIITTTSLEMVLPGVIGYWIDLKLGTKLLFLTLGIIFGVVGGMWQLIKLTKTGRGR